MANIGDLVSKSGVYTEPGVIVEKKDDGNVVVDTEPMQINKYHRHANTTGLTEQEKEEFNRILWKGLKGNKPYPASTSGRDLRQNRKELLERYRQSMK